jgi:two-component system, OmpR family, sensor kinase
MFRSLRFRLPAIFVAGMALAVLVATVVALRLFQDYARDQSLRELNREATGLSRLFTQEAGSLEIPYGPALLELTTGDRIYYVALEGLDIFPGQEDVSGLRRLPADQQIVDVAALPEGRNTSFEFVPPGEDRPFLAVVRPVEEGGARFGAIIVAKPRADVQERWVELLERLAVAIAGGLMIAGGLAWYLSRRISGPMRELAEAADEIAEGRYEVHVPDVPSGDEIGHLADRFREMAARLAEADERERNFLMSVSHELRTPLTAIRGHVEAIREGVVSEPELVQSSLDVVAAETERLERLVGDVLDLAKLQAHRFTVRQEEVDLGRVLDHAYGAFAEEARRREIDYRLEAEEAPVIVSDGDRVLQVISNLLSNAFRWTPDGGRIELGLAAGNGAVSVDVADSGPGVPQQERERIFDPFISHDVNGTGLGLPIARELAFALGGRIELRSEPGRGSRFRLVLPVVADR